MKAVICDDNKECAEEIKRYAEDFFQNESIEFNTQIFCDSEKLYNSAQAYDLAFLDVEMKPYSGMQVAEKLKENNPHIIIFIITSYNKYLDDAMDLNVFRYLQKPIDKKRFESGLKKAIKSIDNTVITFYLKKENTSKSVSSKDIIYIETVGHSTEIVTEKCKFISSNKMDFWKEKLISSCFFRVHKSYLINMNYITDYKRDGIVLCEKYPIPVSYRKQSEFRKSFLSFIGGR